jgi:hypothetical protein
VLPNTTTTNNKTDGKGKVKRPGEAGKERIGFGFIFSMKT